ncbi:MAG TPA: 5-deoxy-glucuronate isomerase [Thermoleophilaceae bacterium]|nr:5-deoxy-glucuronate isomerase [Thermoleophilaceae bacterium]
MSLLVRGSGGAVEVTPESAGWEYVGFEALALGEGEEARRPLEGRECCVVALSGRVAAAAEAGRGQGVASFEFGARGSPFDGLPEAAYLPPGGELVVSAAGGPAEAGLCFAPASRGAEPRVLRVEDAEVRGHGAMERRIHNILMGDGQAERLLVTEVLTPAGHWSSYPPHKHDRDDPPGETLLEETYYHRLRPAHGFGLQRVYSDDGALDESVAFSDGDVVLVPRGYHTVSAPPGYELYYLNVMAGPRREWRIMNDPDHEWLLRTSTTS